MTAGVSDNPPAYSHEPVMCSEVVELLSAVPNGVGVDATIGGGGHAAALLDACDHIQIVGLDRDPAALQAAATRLAGHRKRVTLRNARFDSLGAVLDDLGHSKISACLFDLGVSSAQLDHAERGFSYRRDGPLDMRMDPADALTAADIVNHSDLDHLAAVLYDNADERHSRRIARAIIAARPLTSTTQLAQVIARAVPGTKSRRTHPARRTFQALRIEVNSELKILEPALTAAIRQLSPAGRCVVLSYHSGEDRIVKNVFREAAGEPRPTRPNLPPSPVHQRSIRLLCRRPMTPTAQETASNRRAAPARLRAGERLDEDN